MVCTYYVHYTTQAARGTRSKAVVTCIMTVTLKILNLVSFCFARQLRGAVYVCVCVEVWSRGTLSCALFSFLGPRATRCECELPWPGWEEEGGGGRGGSCSYFRQRAHAGLRHASTRRDELESLVRTARCARLNDDPATWEERMVN